MKKLMIKIMKLSAYEERLKIKSDLSEALSQVKQMQEGRIKKQSLSDFLMSLPLVISSDKGQVTNDQ